MKNRVLQLFVVFSCAFIIISCGGNKKDEKPKAPPPAVVNVYTLKKKAAVYYDEYPATVAALNQVDLKSTGNRIHYRNLFY